MQILGISGSLRAGSANTALLLALVRLVPAPAIMTVARPLDRLPHFNPDLDGAVAPLAVQEWRAELAAADALFFCSPEYARGIPGVLKNALDWDVSSGAAAAKPVGILNASPNYLGAENAHAALTQVLTAMSLRVIAPACVRIAGVYGKLDAHGNVVDPVTRQQLQDAAQALVHAVAPR